MKASERIGKVRALLQDERLDGVIITTQANMSWLFKGRYFINLASESAAACLFITPNRVECLVNNIESNRLVSEEGLEFDEVHVVPWYDENERNRILATWVHGKQVKEDTQLLTPFRHLRTVLAEAEMEQFRWLGKEAARIVESACRTCAKGDLESDVAGRIVASCYQAGIEPIVTLVAGERRASLYRHPLPTSEKINEYAIVSIGARKWGLVASVTRMVHFGTPSDEIQKKHEAVTFVDASMISASRPGKKFSELLETGVQAYSESGFPKEWQCHHQGGLAGYQSREIRATATTHEQICEGQAIAWNPTIRGVKSEDTILVLKDGNEVLTETGQFPLTEIRIGEKAVKRPAILIR